ncbi:MAG TPA: threonine synthase [Solirubrobacterales bacterium]|jgi:threonine synthase|nr:threonine synthase [Solirubrobacterales bacterium]
MSDATASHPGGPAGPRTSSCATELICRDCGYRTPLLDTAFKCPACGEGLDVDYDYERAAAEIAERGLEGRPWNIWRFEELLPITARDAQQRVGQFAGQTPLIRADRLGAEIGLRNLYLKDDSTNRPTLSYKDRVVGMAIARLLELGKDEVGCVSTGNVGTAVAALAAKAGASAYIFYPGNMEKGKAKACRALGAQVCQLDGNYDQANRACRELSLASGIEFANITLRPFYAEGAKTMAFEVVEQLGWKAPDHWVIPAAGGTLSSRVHKGLNELEMVGLAETAGSKINIAQAGGCSPIATAIREGGELEPQVPETAAHSLAIGAPGDGNLVLDAVRTRGGSAAGPSDPEIFEAIDLLGATEGILTEPAGGTTIAATARLAAEGKLDPDETVVAVISGNGLKTLSEHPDKPWPEMVACDVDTMGEMLHDFRQAAAAALH